MSKSIIEENARISYFYWKGAWKDDLWAVIVNCFILNHRSAYNLWWRGFYAFRSGFRSWLYAVFLFTSALCIWSSVVWMCPLLVCALTLIACICVLFSTLIAFELNVAERCYLSLFRMKVICPSCHRPPLYLVPEYECPTCGARQHSLLPTAKYGAFYRVCSQCATHLPTSRFLGRHTLKAFCPHAECGVSFDKDIESRVLNNVAFIGAQRVGKTSLLMALVNDFTQSRLESAGWSVSYPSPIDQERVQHLCLDLSHGVRQPSTRGEVRALSIDIKRESGVPQRLCLYDPPGEVFRTADTVASQNYFRYMKVALFVVDPFAIPDVTELKNRHFPNETMSVADSPPDESFTRWLIALEQSMAVNTHLVPCAIVINKTDSPGLQQQTQLAPGASPETCERFLTEYGLGNMVAEFRNTFGEVSFFAVAAHPAVDEDNTAPHGIRNKAIHPLGIEPLAVWITNKLNISKG